MYSEKVMKIFKNPKNIGKIVDADGIGEVGNPTCGDKMRAYIKIGKRKKGDIEEGYIKNVKVETIGCVAAIVTSSRMTELVRGKSLAEAERLTEKDVAQGLNLPEIKFHCSVLAAGAIKEAIKNYKEKKEKSLVGGSKNGKK